jgi:hypothetical protein
MKTQIENKIKQNLEILLKVKITVDFLITEDKFLCFIKTKDGRGIHTTHGNITTKGIYLTVGHTSSHYRRKGIAQSIRESIHKVLKEENKGVVYTNKKEFIDPAKTPNNISPLYELWEKLVSRGKAEKKGDEYIMI